MVSCSLFLFLLGTFFLAEAYIPMGDDSDFPMGMRYDEEFNIKKLKPKVKLRKTIESYRLPKAIVPIHYELELKPIVETPPPGAPDVLWTCPGKVVIQVLCAEATNAITLHSKKLVIDNARLKVVNSFNETDNITVTGYNMDEERSFYTIFLDKDLSTNTEYLVTIPFVAPIPAPEVLQAGIYRTYYLGSDGVQKTGVMTQFQKDDASRAFPCFDEPQLKAEYTIKIGRPQDQWQSFCNMEQVGEPTPIEGWPGWVWDSYNRTITMSTYILAFAVMTDYVAEETPAGLYRHPIKTWVPKSTWTNDSVKFAAQASGKALTFFEGLFDTPFYLSKMENLGVENMDLLAMEHPGLVTYRTSILVFHKEKDTQWDLFNIATLIAHEYAHQWFGNLVTCKWWNDFWLNEAFARYFQFVGADHTGLNMKATDRFVIDVVQWAMEFDEDTETVSIRNEETDKVFYQPFHIEYEKGASVVRMIQSILTQKTFVSALRRYFKRHMWKTVIADDLYTALTEQAVEDGTVTKYTIGQVMKPWLTKTGYPILQVSKADNDRVFVSQQRFIMHPAANDKIEPGLWYVPIWYITKSNPNYDGDNTPPTLWMDKDTLTTYLPVNITEDWIIINPEGRGYYRVVYDRALTTLIAKQLHENHTVFDASTRSQLFDNYFRSARARYITIGHALILTTYLHKEDDIVVWTTIFNNYRKTYQRLIDTPIIDQFKKYLLRHLRPAAQRLGLTLPPGAPTADIMLQSMFMDWLCLLEDDICETLVKEYMKKWMSKPEENPIPVDNQNFVFCAAVAGKIENIFPFIFEQLKKVGTNWRFRNSLIRALTCSKDADYLKDLVQMAISKSHPEVDMGQHGIYILLHVVRNSMGRNIVWDFVKLRTQEIINSFGPNAISQIIDAVAPYMSNRGISNLNYEFMLYIQGYMKNNPQLITKKVHESLTKSAARIVENSCWMDYFYDDLKEFLSTAKQANVF